MKAPGILFCEQCDRLFAAYNAAISRGDRDGALMALKRYDEHRDLSHGKGPT